METFHVCICCPVWHKKVEVAELRGNAIWPWNWGRSIFFPYTPFNGETWQDTFGGKLQGVGLRPDGIELKVYYLKSTVSSLMVLLKSCLASIEMIRYSCGMSSVYILVESSCWTWSWLCDYVTYTKLIPSFRYLTYSLFQIEALPGMDSLADDHAV